MSLFRFFQAWLCAHSSAEKETIIPGQVSIICAEYPNTSLFQFLCEGRKSYSLSRPISRQRTIVMSPCLSDNVLLLVGARFSRRRRGENRRDWAPNKTRTTDQAPLRASLASDLAPFPSLTSETVLLSTSTRARPCVRSIPMSICRTSLVMASLVLENAKTQ